MSPASRCSCQLLLEADHQRSRIGFSYRLAAAFDRDLVHSGLLDRVRRNGGIKLVAVDKVRLELAAVQQYLMERPESAAFHFQNRRPAALRQRKRRDVDMLGQLLPGIELRKIGRASCRERV